MPRENPDIRAVTDVETLRALAHPVRLALREALSLGPPRTATELGEEIGESPTTCSFHLRQLARYGFVEEAGGGKGRARPWKLTTIGMTIAGGTDDPQFEIAGAALSRALRTRQLARYTQWVETRANYPKEWRQAASDTDLAFYLTPDELRDLNNELFDSLVTRYRDRLQDPSKRPPGALPVELLIYSYPIKPPASEHDEKSARRPAKRAPRKQSRNSP